MNIRRSQAGVGHLAALMVVVLVAVVGFAGYYVWNANQTKSGDTTSKSANSTQTSVVPTIRTNADLIVTSKFLDETSAQLDSGLDASSLDGDISQLL